MEPFRNNVNDNNFLYLSMGERVQLKKRYSNILYVCICLCVYVYCICIIALTLIQLAGIDMTFKTLTCCNAKWLEVIGGGLTG